MQSEKMAAVGLLAAGVSHEFNNIIASMYGFAQIAKKNEQYKEKTGRCRPQSEQTRLRNHRKLTVLF